MSTVRPYTAADHPAVSAVLAAAFDDDPGYVHMFPDNREACLLEVLPRLFSLRVDHGSEATVVELDGRVVAIRVVSSSRLRPTMMMYVRYGLYRMPFTLGMPTVRRMLRADGEVSQLRNLVEPVENHPHLTTLAVHPDAQGRGIGSTLMREWTATLPHTSPASLVTTKADNVLFYEKFGFGIAGQVGVAGAFTAWVMTRRTDADRKQG